MMEILRQVQDSAVGVWLRESDWGIFGALIIHTFTMGFMIGTAAVISARALGLIASVPFERIGRLFIIMQIAGLLAILSGIALVWAYPGKALTNPLFYVKLTLALLAFLLSWRLVKSGGTGPLTITVAVAALVLWPVALTMGKFLAYTNRILMVM